MKPSTLIPESFNPKPLTLQAHNFNRFLSGTLSPFFISGILGSPFLKQSSRKKGTLILMGLLRNLVYEAALNMPAFSKPQKPKSPEALNPKP